MDFKKNLRKSANQKSQRLMSNVFEFPKESRDFDLKSMENLPLARPSLWIFILCDFHLWMDAKKRA
jgi:hypothetical protein